MALGSTQPLTEMSTRNRPLPKVDNLPPSCVVVTKSGNLNFLEPSGPLRACNRTALPFTAAVRNSGILFTEHNDTTTAAPRFTAVLSVIQDSTERANFN